jgi:glycosidase
VEDHIFGTFSTDALKLAHERAVAMGLQHHARTIPLDPAPDEPFALVVTSGADFAAQEVVVRYTTNGEEPNAESQQVAFAPVQRYWSTAAWGYVTEWQARLPALAEGTLLRYRVAARELHGPWQLADWPNPQRVVEQALVHGDTVFLDVRRPEGSEFARSIDRFAPPVWAQEAIIYQIFLDRFARDEDEPWPDTSLDIFHGGTLRGVIRHLDHIAGLGATCIWLSPLFPSPTYHGYDATNYYEVEPRLGTKADLKELVERAHALGMRVLLDFICNHVSAEHPVFRQALAEPESPAGRWFWVGPDHGPHGYRSFFGVPGMPEFNTDEPEVRDYLIGAAEMWLRDFNVDGYRLDYAHGPSHAFWAHFWRTVKRAKPDAWCFGEVVDAPDNLRGYAGYLDGVLDFHLGEALRHVFAHRSRDLAWLDHFLHDHDAFFPPHDCFSRPAFLDNHDMDRFLFQAVGDAEAALRLASLFLYTLPNPPLLYYGTEIALTQRYGKADGYGLEVSREPMQWSWSDGQRHLLAFYQRLATLRRREPAMRPVQRQTLIVSTDHYLGRHQRGEQALLLAINRGSSGTILYHPALTGSFIDLLAERAVTLNGALELGPVQGCLLKPS